MSAFFLVERCIGYSPTLRSGTQGKAEFSMEFEKYAQVPAAIAEELIR